MRQSCLLGLMIVLWMINDAQDHVTKPGDKPGRSYLLSQSVSEPSNASISRTFTSFTDPLSMTDRNSPDNSNTKLTAELAPCDPPTAVNVGSITTTAASVSFTSAATNFIAEYGPVGFTPGSGASAGTNGTIVTGISSPIALTGLSDGTTYVVYVRTDCGIDGFSINAGPVSFSTGCGIANIPYMERFDDPIAPAVPNCITVQNVNGGNTWRTVGTDFDVSDSNIMRLDYETDGVTPADDWFFTKGLNLTGGTGYRLRFQYRNSDSTDFIEKVEVKYGSAANAGSMTSGTLFTNTNINFNSWAETDVDFTPVSTGVYYIGFHGFSDADQAFLAVDNVNVIATPVCDPPVNVSVQALTSTTATIVFNSPGTSFIVEYGTPRFTPGTGATSGGGTVVTSGFSQLTLTGLTPSAKYDVYVRRDCGGSISPNSLVASFTTRLVNDDAPGAIAVTVDAPCTGNGYMNEGATQSTNEPFPSCAGTGGNNTVWYKFVAPSGGAVKISNDFAGSGLGDSRLAVFTATDVNDYTTFTILGCDDDNGVISTDKSIVYLTGLTPGNTYYIQVDGHNSLSAQGSFCLEVSSLTSSMIAGTAACGNSQGFTGLNPSYQGWISLVDNSGNLIANVKQTAGTATAISASVNVNTLSVRQDPISLQYYLDRNYKIDAAGATSADVQFFFLNNELTTLTSADADATLSNLKVTQQSGTTCQADFAAANGTNTELAQTNSGAVNGVNWVTVNTPGFSNFYLHSSKLTLTTKVFLQGAYSSGLSRHKDVTAGWTAILNANAKGQPYNTAAFGNYAGTETITSFAAPSVATTDILDWVLLEIKNSSNGLVARRAAFVREDGNIVDLDGVSPVKFLGLGSGNYYLTIRHRNHLGISTQDLLPLTARSLGVAPVIGYDFDFSTAMDAGIFGTSTAYKTTGSTNVMICGNTNSNANVRFGGLSNDVGPILIFLGSTTNVISNVYTANDVNMDGVVRFGGLNNDVGFLQNNALGGSTTLVVVEQKR